MTNNYPYTWFVPTEKELAEVDIEQLQDLLALTLDERLRRHEGARQLVLKLKQLSQSLDVYTSQLRVSVHAVS